MGEGPAMSVILDAFGSSGFGVGIVKHSIMTHFCQTRLRILAAINYCIRFARQAGNAFVKNIFASLVFIFLTAPCNAQSALMRNDILHILPPTLDVGTQVRNCD
jgi:hypothetical protein